MSSDIQKTEKVKNLQQSTFDGTFVPSMPKVRTTSGYVLTGTEMKL